MATHSRWRAISMTLATKSDKWRQVDDSARVLWLHLLLRSDNRGSLEADAHTAWTHCTKRFGWTPEKTADALDELIDADLVHAWATEDGCDWLHLVDFDSHQPSEFIRRRGRRMSPKPPCLEGGKCDDQATAESGSATLLRTKLGSEKKKEKKKEKKRRDSCEGTEPSPPTDIRTVFNYWVAIDKKTDKGPERLLTADRERVIAARLNEGCTVGELCRSIKGHCNDPWHLGKNDRHKRFTGLKTLLKSREKVESGMQLADDQEKRATGATNYVQPQAIV